MIKLEVEDYCHNCEEFEPVADTNRLYSELEVVESYTSVRCEKRMVCRAIASHIAREMKKGENKNE